MLHSIHHHTPHSNITLRHPSLTMAPTKINRTSAWTTSALALLLASAHLMPVAGSAPPLSTTAVLFSSNATSHWTHTAAPTHTRDFLDRPGPPTGPHYTTLVTSNIRRDVTEKSGGEEESEEAVPVEEEAPVEEAEPVEAPAPVEDSAPAEEAGPSDSADLSSANIPVPISNSQTCASERAEIASLKSEVYAYNLHREPAAAEALSRMTAERDELRVKLTAWETAAPYQQCQKQSSELDGQLTRCSDEIQHLYDCPKRRCWFIICI